MSKIKGSAQPEEPRPKADKAVAKAAPGGAVVTVDYGGDAGAGYEGQDASHLAIPFIGVLQPLSPQLQDEAQFPGWKAGMLFNTVTNDLYGSEVVFVPAHVERRFVEWVPRDKGGGFQGVHVTDSPAVLEANRNRQEGQQFGSKLILPNGNELVDTFYWYGSLLGEDVITPLGMAVVAFTSTKIKVYRAFNTKLNLFAHAAHGIPSKPPLFANRVRIGTVKQENQKGVFWNFTLAPAVDKDVFRSLLPPDSPAYLQARQVRELVQSGAARAAFETQTGHAEGEEDDKEVPF